VCEVDVWKCDVQINSKLAMHMLPGDVPEASYLRRKILAALVPVGLRSLFCCRFLLLQALKPHIFVSVPRLWNRIYDRVMATMREANPVKRRMFETAFAYKRAALEAGGRVFSAVLVTFVHLQHPSH
jgi:hypothetical protein